jgi:hypothetical protein
MSGFEIAATAIRGRPDVHAGAGQQPDNCARQELDRGGPYVHSPNRDNVYVTWTVFKFSPDCLGGSDTAPAFCENPIYGSMSTDHGQTWSAPQEISGTSPLCSFGNFFNPSLPANACDLDQGSSPVVLPDGDLEVAYNNGNTPQGDPNAQQLAVHCHPTGDSVAGTAQLNCASPVKVGDDVTSSEPLCDFGRGPEECIPGAYIRTNDYPRIVTENTRTTTSTRSGRTTETVSSTFAWPSQATVA